MTTRRSFLLVGTLALAGFASRAMPQDSGAVYRPPRRGAPASRVGTGTRSAAASQRLIVLAPDHTGLTVHEQPTLWFYLSRASRARMEVTVINDQAAQPLLDKELAAPSGAGIHALSLREHGVRLVPGLEYRWHVAMITDAEDGGDAAASGTILRAEAPPQLAEKLRAAAPDARYAVYAEEGIWYDAIDELSRALQARPQEKALRRQRARLLRQVGLDEAARQDDDI